MNEDDVWSLPPGIASKSIFARFSSMLYPSVSTKRRMGLIKTIWKANSLDITLDFLLSLTSVICNYSGPFFLKRILDAVSQPSKGDPSPQPSDAWFSALFNGREIRAQAYVYAFLAFLASIIRAQADVQHLWHGRRAATRVRSELMAAIYEKSLKRKDFSGSTDQGKKGDEKDPAAANGKDPAKSAGATTKGDKKESNKASADIGKIVNLMSTDANRICNIISSLYFIYVSHTELCGRCCLTLLTRSGSPAGTHHRLFLSIPVSRYSGRVNSAVPYSSPPCVDFLGFRDLQGLQSSSWVAP